jgi:hypothetical protein
MAGVIKHDLTSGTWAPVNGLTRDQGPSIWASTQSTGYFWGGQGPAEVALDWGDITNPATVGGFAFSYATNADPGYGALITFYGDDNGWNQAGRDIIAGFSFTGLPGTRTPANRNWYWGWISSAELITPMLFAANDLDGDLLGDFSYTYFWEGINYVNDADPNDPTPWVVGPRMCGDPNAGTAPGIEEGVDIYNDPNYRPAPGYFDPNLTHYVGTYWFGGPPVFSQFYMELFAPGCPNRGDAERYCQADIATPSDCVVGLPDLAQLLGNYGCTTGCTLSMGDVDPYDPFFPGDGVIGLGDLAELLGQYGDDCNWPPTP